MTDGMAICPHHFLARPTCFVSDNLARLASRRTGYILCHCFFFLFTCFGRHWRSITSESVLLDIGSRGESGTPVTGTEEETQDVVQRER